MGVYQQEHLNALHMRFTPECARYLLGTLDVYTHPDLSCRLAPVSPEMYLAGTCPPKEPLGMQAGVLVGMHSYKLQPLVAASHLSVLIFSSLHPLPPPLARTVPASEINQLLIFWWSQGQGGRGES